MLGTSKGKKRYLPLVRNKRLGKYNALLAGSIAFSLVVLCFGLATNLVVNNSTQKILGISNAASVSTLITPLVEIIPTPSSTPTPSLTPTPTLTTTAKITKKVTQIPPTSEPTKKSQYTAEKIGDVTWRVKNVENDNTMASPQDIINALNSYRGTHGKSNLILDNSLHAYAQERANHFSSNGSLDSHAGFQSYMNNGGFEKSGFNSLGENSAMLSGPMNGEKIIKNIFGADPSHDGNQLDNWTHVGVGVSGNAINVNFGKNKR